MKGEKRREGRGSGWRRKRKNALLRFPVPISLSPSSCSLVLGRESKNYGCCCGIF